MKKMKKIENIKKYLLIMTLITATVAGAVACNGPEVLSETASEEITESTTRSSHSHAAIMHHLRILHH